MFNFWNPWVEHTAVCYVFFCWSCSFRHSAYSICWTKYFTHCSFSNDIEEYKLLDSIKIEECKVSGVHRYMHCSKIWYWHGKMRIEFLKTVLQFRFQNSVSHAQQVLWDMMPCNLLDKYDILEERMPPIGITGFLDFFHHPVLRRTPAIFQYDAVDKWNLFLSSGEGVRETYFVGSSDWS
jgi:hypothetical protein